MIFPKFTLILSMAASLGAAMEKESPNTAITPRPSAQPARHNLVLAEISREKPNLIFLGDSITHQFGGAKLPNDGTTPHGEATWQHYYANRRALNLGFNGEKTDMMLWRLENGEFNGIQPKVAVILAGTNNCGDHNGTPPNTPEQTVEGIYALVKVIHQKSPSTKIVLLSLLPRHHAGDTAAQIAFPDQVNAILRKPNSASYLTFLSISSDFLDSHKQPNPALFYDGLHPNAQGYALLAKLIEPTLARLLGDVARSPAAP